MAHEIRDLPANISHNYAYTADEVTEDTMLPLLFCPK